MFESARERQAEVNNLRSDREDLVRQLNELAHAHYPSISQARALSSPRFEYLSLDDISTEELDRRGAQGWELVNFASYTVGFGLGGNERMKVHMRYVFKRPIDCALPAELQERVDEMNVLRSHIAEIDQRISELVD